MVPEITLKGPPRPPARRLLPLPLLLLAVMAGKGRADMGCYESSGTYFLSDPSKCWVTEINAALNGEMDACKYTWQNAVSRMRVRKCAVRSVLLLCVQPSFPFRLSSPLLQFPEMKDEIIVTAWCCGMENSTRNCIPARLAR